MKSFLIHFLYKTFPYLLIINSIALVLFFLVKKSDFFSLFIINTIISLFFYSTTGIFFSYTLKLAQNTPSKFINGYMIISVFKLLLYLLVLILTLVFFKKQIKILLITYALNYFVFSILELKMVYKILKKL